MDYDQLLSDISAVNGVSHALAARSVNQILTLRNWLIGAYIFEFEQNGEDRAAYGGRLLHNLSADLQYRNITGFSETNLRNFRLFALTYPNARSAQTLQLLLKDFSVFGSSKQIQQTVPAEFSLEMPAIAAKALAMAHLSWQNSEYYDKVFSSLSWSHFQRIMRIGEPLKRAFYELETMKSGWSERELKRQMDSALFERIGLSKDKDGVLALAQQGQVIDSPIAVLRDPYVFEFLGLEERSKYSEAELEKALIDHLQSFMRELGRDFCFVDRQYRIVVDGEDYYLDLLFYHRKLRCLVAVDLKIGAFKHEYAGQMNFYLNYLRYEQTYEDENPPIGILLCTAKSDTTVKYATGGMDNQLFVSRYQSVLPSVEQLQQWLQSEKAYLLQLAEDQ